MPPPGNQVLLLTVQVGGLSGQELSERPDLQPLRTRVGLSPRNLCSQRGEEGYTLAPRGPVGLWFRPGFSSICFVKKARNGEVFGLDSGWIFLLCGEPFSLGAASFAKDSEGKEGRKEGSWQLFLLRRLQKNSLFQPLEPGPLCGYIPGGASRVQYHVLCPWIVHYCNPACPLHTKLPGYRIGHLED